MFEYLMRIMVFTLSLEAVVLLVVFISYLGTLMQKNMKEIEAAEAVKKALEASRGLSETIKKSSADMELRSKEAHACYLASLIREKEGFPLTH